MRITNTVKEPTRNNILAKGFRSQAAGLLFTFCILGLFSGCGKKDTLQQAQDYTRQYEEYYQRAVALYKDLIAEAKIRDGLYFQLGKLYYSHGEFLMAQEALRQSNNEQAKKFLAISLYHLANFTDALEAFNKNKIPDDEYLYYHGLTCEKLNLFDQALEIYKKIKDNRFLAMAKLRADIIEKEAGSLQIRDIDPQINNILANAPQQEQYPQAGALILSCDEEVEVRPDDTQVSTLHYLVKILNERGKEDFSEAQIDYDSTFEKVELIYARTIKPDGVVVEVGSRHIRDVSKYLNFPLYSNVRVCIISFPEITEGASLEYKLRIIRNQLINKKDFVLDYPLQAHEPIIAANFKVTLPQEKPLHIKIINDKYNDFNADLNPRTETSGGRLIYRWQFKDIPQIIPESNMPPDAEVNPTLLLSTFNGWQDIYKWWWALAKEKIKADEAIKEKVKELVGEKASEIEQARAIYNFCAQKIRYVAVEYGQAGYQPHYAADIFKNKYGDCKDQAILLVTMLREAGFFTWPVLIATKEHYNLNTEFPAVLFNHCIAALSVKEEVIFLDPTAETCPFGDLPGDDQARKVLICRDDGYEILQTPPSPSERNLLKQQLAVKVNNNEGIKAEKSVFTYGIYDQGQRYWLLYTQPELIREALKEKIQDISIGARLEKYNIENLNNLNLPVVLSYSFGGDEYFTSAGKLRILPQLTGLDASLVAKDKRKYPIDFGILDSKEIIFEIEIPKNFVITYMPDSIAQDSPWLRLSVEYSRKNNKLFFKQKIDLKKGEISQGEYPAFKNFFEGLAKKIKQRIILQKAG